MYSKILIAHDLSKEADVALQRAVQLAQQHQAQLSILHIVEDSPSKQAFIDIQKKLEAQLRAKLPADLAAQVAVYVKHGKAAEAVLSFLHEQNYSLLVLGQHHKVRPELFKGSNLERIARDCTIPVLLAVNADVRAYREAVVALDSSLISCQALHAAYHLLPADAGLHAINIFNPGPKLKLDRVAQYLETQRSVIEQLLEDEIAQLPKNGPAVSHEVVHGVLAASLDKELVARRRSPLLLALGRHNRSLLAQKLLGSLAIHYLRKPPCDVLVVA